MWNRLSTIWPVIQAFLLLLSSAVHCAADNPLASISQYTAIREVGGELKDARRLTKLYMFVTGKPASDAATKSFASTANGQIRLDKIRVVENGVLINDGSHPPFGIRLAMNDFSKLLDFFTETHIEQTLGVRECSLKYVLKLLCAAINILVNPFAPAYAMREFRHKLKIALNNSNTEGFGSVEKPEDMGSNSGVTSTSLRTILDIYTGTADKLEYFASRAYSADKQDNSLILYDAYMLNDHAYILNDYVYMLNGPPYMLYYPRALTVLLHLIRLCKITELNLRSSKLIKPLSKGAQDILAACRITRLVPPLDKKSCRWLFLIGYSNSANDIDFLNIQNRVWHKLTEISWFSRRGDWLQGFGLTNDFGIAETKFVKDLVRPAVRPEDFSALEVLSISGHFPTDRMEYIEGAINLRVLSVVRCDNVASALKALRNMAELETLWLQGTDLTEFPWDVLAGLSKLSSLDISSTRLMALPPEVGLLEGLRRLNLSGNLLTAIPEELGNRRELSHLDLSGNKLLRSFPSRLGSLLHLDISMCQLKELPPEITSCTNLETLKACGNSFKTLPADLGNLKNLRMLDMAQNELTELLFELTELSLLGELYLQYNKLSTLPNSIAQLQYLHTLDLCENQFRRIPSFVKDLKENGSLSLFRILNNPLLNDDKHDQLGLRTLWSIFGKGIMTEHEYKEIISANDAKKRFYDELNSMPVHWNLEMLRQLRLLVPPHSELLKASLESVWGNILGSAAIAESKQLVDGKKLYELIEMLYDPTLYQIRKYEVSESNKAVIKDYLEAVTLNIQARMGQGDTDRAVAMLSQLDDSLGHCPSGQAGALMEIYKLHCLSQDLDDFDGFVKEFVAKEKEDRFTGTLALADHPQNVHLVLYWRMRLADDLGLVWEFADPISRQGPDQFGDNLIGVLQAFFAKFTPENTIKALTGEINKSGRVGSAWLHLMGAGDVPVEKSEAFFVVDKRTDYASYGFPSSIKEAGAEEILVRMNILEIRPVDRLRSSRKHSYESISRP